MLSVWVTYLPIAETIQYNAVNCLVMVLHCFSNASHQLSDELHQKAMHTHNMGNAPELLCITSHCNANTPHQFFWCGAPKLSTWCDACIKLVEPLFQSSISQSWLISYNWENVTSKLSSKFTFIMCVLSIGWGETGPFCLVKIWLCWIRTALHTPKAESKIVWCRSFRMYPVEHLISRHLYQMPSIWWLCRCPILKYKKTLWTSVLLHFSIAVPPLICTLKNRSLHAHYLHL
jgi:hypothetical protein